MYSVYDRRLVLRQRMRDCGVDACYIPTADDHGSEAIADHFKTREFFSGFTGSAGTLILTQRSAHLWTDGRYFIQAENELSDSGAKTVLHRSGEAGVPTIAEYVRDCLAGCTLGFDFATTTLRDYRRTLEPLRAYAVKLVDFDPAQIWQSGRPPLAQDELFRCPSGETSRERLARIRATLQEGETLLLCSLDEIAWTLNLRAAHIDYGTVLYSYLTVSQTEATLFTDAPYAPVIYNELKNAGVALAPYGDVFAWAKTATKVRTDENVSLALYGALSAPQVDAQTCVCRWKAIKNDFEIEHIRDAHMADGLSVTRLLLHLRDGRRFTELSICDDLEIIRYMDREYRCPSFATIAAAGEHGAIVHYQPNEETNAPLEEGLFLLDCGGQYSWGTTDVTRTVALSAPTEEQKRNYTAVLRGHLAVAMATFDETERGDGLDKLARAPLQALGLDYNHGTGHGVGYFLSVHETPPSIRKTAGEPFAAGMVVSDEPGVYLEGQYGIRIENLLLTINAFPPRGEGGSASALPDEGQNVGAATCRPQPLAFETLTYVPYDRTLIDASALTAAERQWVNDYHAEIYRRYLPYLSDWERDQLSAACAAI